MSTALLALWVGAFLLYKLAGVTVTAFVVATVVMAVANIWLWASRPVEPGEFR